MDRSTMFDLKGQVAFVTGAAKGLGLAMAEIVAQSGARVVMTLKPGAPSRTPGGNTMKKFRLNRLQSTLRMLVTSASTGTPWTSSAVLK